MAAAVGVRWPGVLYGDHGRYRGTEAYRPSRKCRLAACNLSVCHYILLVPQQYMLYVNLSPVHTTAARSPRAPCTSFTARTPYGQMDCVRTLVWSGATFGAIVEPKQAGARGDTFLPLAQAPYASILPSVYLSL